MNKWESIFINGISGGLIGVTIMNWQMWPFTLPAFAIVVLWGVYLEKANKEEIN